MKRCLFFVFSMMIASVLMAGPVDQETARQEAQAFINRKASSTFRRAQAAGSELTLAASESAYHVFNVGQGDGFVVVSGSDYVPGVLGYSTEGEFDASSLPDNMKAWLQGYADQVAWLESHGGESAAARANVRRANGVKTSIAPMIQTRWNQGAPYNYLCPDFFTYGKCATGCVATAMAQVLYYHNQTEGFPTGTTRAIEGYYSRSVWSGMGQVWVETCPVATFDWANMQTTYTGKEPSTDVTALAVARLMQYCGASVGMNYANSANGGSSASLFNVAPALNDYFGYDQRVKYLSRKQYSNVDWENIIYAELAAGRPVLYGGFSTGGGHAFVCDGYDSDGYFHINWGWGGHGNSYFLLSVLNPYLTGEIGGSSSPDGYSMNQDIVVGIEKPVGDFAEEEGRLSWTALGLYYGGTDVASRTLTRSATASIGFSYSYYNKLTYTYDFEFALGLFDEANNLVAVSSPWNQDGLDPNSGWSGYRAVTLDLSESVLPTGKTYTLKAVSRIKGTAEWLECKGGDTHFIEAEGLAAEVNLTAKTLSPELQVTDIQLITDGVAETVQTVTATIKNTGTVDFCDNVHLLINGVVYSGNGIEVKAGGSAVATFTFRPTESGTKTVSICVENGADYVQIGSGNITFGTAMSSDDTPTLTFATRLNVEGDKILGNKLIGVVTATNETDNNYQGNITLVRFKWEDGRGEGSGMPQKVTVPAHSSVDVTFEYDVEMDGQYSVVVYYVHGGTNEPVNQAETVGRYYYAKPAVTLIAADGAKVQRLAEPSIAVPDDALVVDLRGQDMVQNVTPNSNPNTLYLMEESADTPTGITANVVKGETAQSLTLTDGQNLCVPFDFTAQSVSYERVFTQGLTADWKGWSTIVLPFDVESVKADGETIDWFHSDSDTDGRFWVYAFTGDDPDEVTFTHASQMKAYRPYLISVPGNAWGEKYNLVGKTLTFEGSNASIQSGAKTSVSGYNYIFRGGLSQQALSNVYVLDAEGENFTKAASATTVDPFRAYFLPSSQGVYGSALAISFKDDNDPTAILAPAAEAKGGAAADAVYNLNGQQVGTRAQWKSLPRGIYIVNGKKISK